jgi:hypothetical protein
MNTTITSKNKLRKWVLVLALLTTPELAWAQYKIYVPPKVYTPPKTSTPRPASQSKVSSSKQPKVKQSQAKQPKEKSQEKVAKGKVQKADRRQQNQEVKREQNQERQQRQAQLHQQKLQQKQLKQQRKRQREQEKAQRKQEKIAKRQAKQHEQKTFSPQPAARSGRTEPQGHVTPLRAGGHAIDTPSGEHYEFNREGKLSSFSKGGTEATFRRDGSFKTVKANGMQIEHGANGVRIVQSQLMGGGRLLSTGPQRGFIERPMTRGGQAYVQRVYVSGPRISVLVYHPYLYRGILLYNYVPTLYYSPGFYRWAYYSWGYPVAFSWDWFGAPWFTFYGPYFAPFPAYRNASLWLTDYLLAADLQAAYQDRSEAESEAWGTAEAYAGGDNGSPVTPEVKFAIADEVRQQLAAEYAIAGDSARAEAGEDKATPPALDPKIRVFVVSSDLTEVMADGRECTLTSGDVIARLADAQDANQSIPVRVLSSKSADCTVGSQFRVSAQDLQEMDNDFRQQIDAGLETLAQKQGQGGLPAGPNADPRLIPDRQPEAPDANAPSLLQQQWDAADRAEADIRQALGIGLDK